MFDMTIIEQLNLIDRTLILGVAKYDAIPKKVVVSNIEYKVLGISMGGNPTYISLEIEKTDSKLVGKKLTESRTR